MKIKTLATTWCVLFFTAVVAAAVMLGIAFTSVQRGPAPYETVPFILVCLSMILVLLVLTFTGAGIFFYKRVISPLTHLQTMVNQASEQQNGETAIPFDAKDEFHDLAEAFVRLSKKKNSVETALEHTSKKLAVSMEELQTFAYIASHDLRTPLHGIATVAQWIAEDTKAMLSEDSIRHLELLNGRISRMEQLLDDLIKYSRLNYQATPEKVDIMILVQNIWMLAAPPENIYMDVATDLPILIADRLQIEIPFRHLLINAVKHHDTQKGVIKIYARSLEQFYEFTIQDDGPGIAEAFQKKIFGIFQTLHPKDSNTTGTGIGLSMVKKVIEQNGGTIHVISNPEKERGTTFVFTWPKECRSVTAIPD